jgi:hypothetical protein
VWILLLTDGTVIEYAPEAYGSYRQAEDEARRWAWILSGMGWLPVTEPFPNRWTAGDHDVRLIEATGDGSWVGTFWTWDGYPDPEATLFPDRAEARSWAVAPIDGIEPRSVIENAWSVVATFERKGEEAYAVTNRLKLLAAP